MKFISMAVAILVLTGCASTEETYKKTSLLNYEAQPKQGDILREAKPIIQSSLKDPDSLKNLKVAAAYRCYASKMEVSDNISPKHDYGYWCYDLAYRATNSYGGYVPGKTIVVYYQKQSHSVNELNETIRKSDDVNVWHAPTLVK
jgi:hypothetical protein